MIEAGTQEAEKAKASEPTRMLTVFKCEIILGVARTVGKSEEITISEAMERFAPSKNRRARMNVINVRSGWYIGLREDKAGEAPVNFIFKNPTKGGNIRWILEQNPEFEELVLELYYVKDVVIPSAIEGELVVQNGRPRA